MQHKPFVITIVGPESSGKTTLARQLAEHFGCPWVPEFAREYLEGLGRSYTAEDLQVIAKGQLESIVRITNEQSVILPPSPLRLRLRSTTEGVRVIEGLKSSLEGVLKQYSFLTFLKEEYTEPSGPMIIVDSGMLSLRVWARIKYGITIPLVEDAMREDVTSLYLITRPLDHWEPDPLREAPTLLDRVWIYNQYLKDLYLMQSMQPTLK